MSPFIVTLIISLVIFFIFLGLQVYFFIDTLKYRNIFEHFFSKESDYNSRVVWFENEQYPRLDLVGAENSDLNSLLEEINIYLFKTKGTSDYEFIRNKVERKLNMRYDQSTVHLAFPTYIGLMGTFLGVFLGIFMFLSGYDDLGNVSDQSIKNLLLGVLVSMSTSLVGLALTTINNALAGRARKKIEDDKNEFYDFIQTDVTKTASASLVSAISKLHDTVDRFEPAFSTVIEGFKSAFRDCTRAFGDDFKKNVDAVTTAVDVMGRNMDKINQNIQVQEKLLGTLKSKEFIQGMDKYIEAADHFVGITQSLNKFEQARRMMLAAAQEAIAIQNQYNESLKIPREIAIRINQILDRIKDFEKSVNETGRALNQREILGNDVVNAIQEQIRGISKKASIADKYLSIADGKLEDLYKEQVKVIGGMNENYKRAIAAHIEGFEKMLSEHSVELDKRHKAFLDELQAKFNIEEVRTDFSNLRKLNEILEQIKQLTSNPVKAGELNSRLQKIQEEIARIDVAEKKGGGLGSIFGGGNNGADISKLRSDNASLKKDIDNLTAQVRKLTDELSEAKKGMNNIKEEPKKKSFFGFGN